MRATRTFAATASVAAWFVLVSMVCGGWERTAYAANVDLEFPNFLHPTVPFQLNGNASVLTNGVLRVVPAQPSQDGSMFLSAPIKILDSDFKSTFQFQITSTNFPGERSDGLAFVIQSDPRGAEALGGDGARIGYGDNPPDPAHPGINPSVDIEFDTHQNFQFFPPDPNDNHVGIMENGDNGNHLAIGTPSWRLDDGEIKTATIEYNHTTHLLSILLTTTGSGSTAPLSFALNIDVNSIAGDKVLFGFTAATGGGFADFDVLNWQLTVTAIFAGTPGRPNCHGQSVSALAQQYGGLNAAAAALGYSNVQALQEAIMEYCED
jgi:Legume lectin domain